jgi:hypothetical protein
MLMQKCGVDIDEISNDFVYLFSDFILVMLGINLIFTSKMGGCNTQFRFLDPYTVKSNLWDKLK